VGPSANLRFHKVAPEPKQLPTPALNQRRCALRQLMTLAHTLYFCTSCDLCHVTPVMSGTRPGYHNYWLLKMHWFPLEINQCRAIFSFRMSILFFFFTKTNAFSLESQYRYGDLRSGNPAKHCTTHTNRGIIKMIGRLVDEHLKNWTGCFFPYAWLIS
jgi:hypothetical protein